MTAHKALVRFRHNSLLAHFVSADIYTKISFGVCLALIRRLDVSQSQESVLPQDRSETQLSGSNKL